MYKIVLKVPFYVNDEWKPMEGNCWSECPFASLTNTDEECRAKRIWETGKTPLCPIVKFKDNSEIDQIKI